MQTLKPQRKIFTRQRRRAFRGRTVFYGMVLGLACAGSYVTGHELGASTEAAAPVAADIPEWPRAAAAGMSHGPAGGSTRHRILVQDGGDPVIRRIVNDLPEPCL